MQKGMSWETFGLGGWETMVQEVCVICEEKRETRAACVPCLPEKGPSLRS